MKNRLKKILNENELDLIYIVSPTNIFYFTGFLSDPHERIFSLIYDKNDKIYMILPLLDLEAAKSNVKLENIEYIPYEDGTNPYIKLKEKIGYKIERVGIDKENITLKKYEDLQEILEFKKAISIDENIKNLRVIKSEKEIEYMKKASELADKCIEIAKNNLKENITELELKNIIETEIKKYGVKNMSFETIVLFGKNASKPHGVSSNTKLEKNTLVLLDLGCYYNNYASDITRCLFFGEIDKFHKQIYDIVLEANTKAIQSCKIGKTFSEIDKVARDIISNYGYGKYFTHRLGHGLGIDCHEYPNVMSGNELKIEEGMVFTIEPGIYIPNEIGVRIEDDILVTKDGAISLTKYKK